MHSCESTADSVPPSEPPERCESNPALELSRKDSDPATTHSKVRSTEYTLARCKPFSQVMQRPSGSSARPIGLQQPQNPSMAAEGLPHENSKSPFAVNTSIQCLPGLLTRSKPSAPTLTSKYGLG